VVFRLTKSGPLYLLVEASGDPDRWVLPKGHIEKGETAASAALREVAEEAGVRARLVQRLKRVQQKKGGDRIHVVYFLMAYEGRASGMEDRAVRWCSVSEAEDLIDVARVRKLVGSTDRLLSHATREPSLAERWRWLATLLLECLILGGIVLALARPALEHRHVPVAAMAALALPVGFGLRALFRWFLSRVERAIMRRVAVQESDEELPLRLRVLGRVAVHLGGRGEQHRRAQPLSQAEHVDRAVHAGLRGLHRVALVEHRRGRAGQVVDLVDLDVQGERHVVAHQLESRLAEQVDDVVPAARVEIVDGEDVVT